MNIFSKRTLLSLSMIGFMGATGSFAAAQAQPIGNLPTFNIVDGWNVQNTPLSNAANKNKIQLPCVMTAEFDNGYIMRLSGGGSQIMAMAIDFRQDIFRQGRKYDTLVTTDSGQYDITATGFSSNVLLFKINDKAGFYNAVSRNGPLVVDVEGNTFRFMMAGIVSGMRELESCYAPGSEATFRVAAPLSAPMSASPMSPPMSGTGPVSLVPSTNSMEPMGKEAPIIARLPEPAPVPAPMVNNMDGSLVAPSEPIDVAANDVPMDKPATKSMMKPVMQKAPAPQMDPVKQYPAWGDRTPPAPKAPTVAASKMKSMDVQQPASVPTMAGASNTMVEKPVISEPVNVLPVKQYDRAIQETVWTAQAGESIESVIARWSNRAGVELQWQAGPPMPVARTLEYRGTFNEAVQVLMAENAAANGLNAQMQGVPIAQAQEPSTMPMVMPPSPAVSKPLAPVSSTRMEPTVSRATPTSPMNRIDRAPLMPVATNMNAPMAPAQPNPPMMWSAPAGASLQGVLEFWSKQSGVDFVWNASHNFELYRGVNNSQSYESAVQSVLEQYSSHSLRPTAQLNKDPKTGQKTLFVFSGRQG